MRPFYLGWVFPAFSAQWQTLDKRREKIKERNKWINERKNQHESSQRTERRRARTDERTTGYIIIYFPYGFIQTDLSSMNKFLRLVMFGDCFFTYRVMALWLAETRCRKRERAVSRFPINSRFIHLIWRFYYNVSVNSHSQLSVYSKGNTHSTYRCKHVEQCHIWGDKTRAAYMSFGYV